MQSQPASATAATRSTTADIRRDPRPNLIVILTDDQSPRTLGFDGNPVIRTPNLDRLAREGTYFSRAYVPLPQCAPSRAALLTGRYPHEHGPMSNRQARLAPGVPTLAERLSQAGYRCGFVGKWHLNRPLEAQAGFDWWVAYDREATPRPQKYVRPVVVANGESHRYERYLTDVFTDYALEFIDQQSPRPFFLWLAYHAPHTPITPHPDHPYDPASIVLPESMRDDLVSKPRAQLESASHRELTHMDQPALREQTASYYSMISAIDANVGRIVQHLHQRRIAERTLVVFISDNGWLLGEHNLWGKGPMLYEETVRVPLILWQPGAVPAGRRIAALVTSLDLFPTLLRRGGLTPPAGVPGNDLWPLVQGRTRRLHDAVYLEYMQQGRADVQDIEPMLGIVTEQFKYTRYLRTDEEELYLLADDPLEMSNVAADPVHQQVRDRLRARLDAFQRSIRKPFW